MSSRHMVIALVFLSQTAIGVLGNFSLLYHYVFLYITGCKLRSTDLIFKHLIVVNSLFILTNGVPRTMIAFGLKYFINDFGCRLILYVYRVGRGMCLGSTCLLSIFQVITISPRNSRLAKLNVQAPKYIGLSIALCWLLFMLVNIIFPLYVIGNKRNVSIRKKKNLGFCSAEIHDKRADSLYAVLLSLPDALCLGLMLWASSSMVSILYRHKQRVQHIHRISLSPRSSPESRATQTILLLLSTYVSFYIFSSILQFYIVLFENYSLWLLNMTSLFAACFPTVSPFVLLGRDSRLSMVTFSCRRNITPPSSIRYM
ncbi:vomeronasal type-1 receptor 4-like [Tamandua tetradactyla]|uniref:vomeronasal type-1 receptor 4-like n=1 Tax=Tamandua tetradactyla TaxID=48850 RepID=UPI004053AC76